MFKQQRQIGWFVPQPNPNHVFLLAISSGEVSLSQINRTDGGGEFPRPFLDGTHIPFLIQHILNIGIGEFRGFAERLIWVNEIFETLQGFLFDLRR